MFIYRPERIDAHVDDFDEFVGRRKVSASSFASASASALASVDADVESEALRHHGPRSARSTHDAAASDAAFDAVVIFSGGGIGVVVMIPGGNRVVIAGRVEVDTGLRSGEYAWNE